MGYILLIVGIIIFIIDVYLFFISLNFAKKRCGKCKGFLLNTVQQKNVYVGGKSGRFYKHYLNYVYIYRVNGKEYRISGGVSGTKDNISSTADVIYQKNNPKFAYIKNLTLPIQPILALIICPVWIMLMVCGFILI